MDKRRQALAPRVTKIFFHSSPGRSTAACHLWSYDYCYSRVEASKVRDAGRKCASKVRRTLTQIYKCPVTWHLAAYVHLKHRQSQVKCLHDKALEL
jgi:hypothetical protein